MKSKVILTIGAINVTYSPTKIIILEPYDLPKLRR